MGSVWLSFHPLEPEREIPWARSAFHLVSLNSSIPLPTPGAQTPALLIASPLQYNNIISSRFQRVFPKLVRRGLECTQNGFIDRRVVVDDLFFYLHFPTAQHRLCNIVTFTFPTMTVLYTHIIIFMQYAYARLCRNACEIAYDN